MPQPDAGPRDLVAEIDRFVDAHRLSCLWFLRPDFYPRTPAEQLRVLQAIERHGTLDAFSRARALRLWLSRPSSEPSVVF